jgi:hypothetical protein
LAQLDHSFVQAAIEIHERIRTPKVLADLLSGYQFVGPRQEQTENTEWLLLKSNTVSVFAQLAGPRV